MACLVLYLARLNPIEKTTKQLCAAGYLPNTTPGVWWEDVVALTTRSERATSSRICVVVCLVVVDSVLCQRRRVSVAAVPIETQLPQASVLNNLGTGHTCLGKEWVVVTFVVRQVVEQNKQFVG